MVEIARHIPVAVDGPVLFNVVYSVDFEQRLNGQAEDLTLQ
jgi:hypothetical protein